MRKQGAKDWFCFDCNEEAHGPYHPYEPENEREPEWEAELQQAFDNGRDAEKRTAEYGE
jgi:hypothetical protein